MKFWSMKDYERLDVVATVRFGGLEKVLDTKISGAWNNCLRLIKNNLVNIVFTEAGLDWSILIKSPRLQFSFLPSAVLKDLYTGPYKKICSVPIDPSLSKVIVVCPQMYYIWVWAKPDTSSALCSTFAANKYGAETTCTAISACTMLSFSKTKTTDRSINRKNFRVSVSTNRRYCSVKTCYLSAEVG